MTILPSFSVTQLSYHRNDEAVFDPVNFSLDAGEGLVIIGQNGSGKSTLLALLAGLLEPETGDIQLNNDSHPIGFVGHQLGLNGDLSVAENLAFYAAFNETSADLELTLTEFGLISLEDNLVKQLSAGQRKRAALARLSFYQQKLWLLDEPFSNLDGDGVNRVCALINQHLDRQGMLVITSHQSVESLLPRCRSLTLEAAANAN